MTKVPEPGKVKTRLTPPLTPAEAAGLNICFLKDTAAAIQAAGAKSRARGVGVYTPAGGERAYEGLLPNDFVLLPQRGDGFGERLTLAMQDLLACGFEAACLIDSDSPTVPAASYRRAAELLSEPVAHRVVIGPSDDGGYYLIGMRQNHRVVFEDIDWSTDRVLQQTIDRARSAKLDVQLLPQGYDVDDAQTLRRLCDELLGNDATPAAPATRHFLAKIVEREGRARIWPE